jgi:DNA-binding transcriptional ArsR family regulator
MSYESVLDALGDPTRRRIVEGLRDGPLPVGAIARPLPVSRPAVSRHLRVLEAAGLVNHEAVGTRRLYRLDERGLGELRRWVDGVWATALDRFAAHIIATEEPDRRA